VKSQDWEKCLDNLTTFANRRIAESVWDTSIILANRRIAKSADQVPNTFETRANGRIVGEVPGNIAVWGSLGIDGLDQNKRKRMSYSLTPCVMVRAVER